MAFFKKIYKHVSEKFMNLSIKYKIIILFYSIITFISVLLGYYSYRVSSNIIQKELGSTILRDTQKVARDINFLQKDVDDLSTFICLDSNIQKFIRSNASVDYDNNASFGALARLLASKDYISYMGIYGGNGSKYYLSSDGSSGMSNYDLVQLSDIYKKAKALKGRPMWVALNDKNQIFIPDNKAPKIAMCRTILNTDTYEESGFLIICINVSTIKHAYFDNLSSKDRNILLLNNNEIITSGSLDNLEELQSHASELMVSLNGHEEGNKNIRFNNKNLLLAFSTVTETPWKVVYLVTVKELLMGLKPILSLTLLVILGCLIIAMIISLYVSSILTDPIKKLLLSMKRVKEGYFKEKVDLKYMDEIGMLGLEYNDMIDNINDLIDKVYKLQIREREAELKALQAQINPHFLYNTLDAIYWKAQKSKDKDISEMVYALSKLFRLTLNRGNEFTLVKNEKEFIEYYLLLQKRRFQSKLEYTINMEDNILQYTMPKLILQPFVENSIVHATERDSNKSLIQISGYYIDNKIKFVIEDDGGGIEEGVVKELLNNKSSRLQKGYAIGNINERLSLYYNGDYTLDITSEPGKGTKVEIIIPAAREELN